MADMHKVFKVFKLSELKPHPRNKTIYGEEKNDETFDELVQLIKTHGLRTKMFILKILECGGMKMELSFLVTEDIEHY